MKNKQAIMLKYFAKDFLKMFLTSIPLAFIAIPCFVFPVHYFQVYEGNNLAASIVFVAMLGVVGVILFVFFCLVVALIAIYIKDAYNYYETKYYSRLDTKEVYEYDKNASKNSETGLGYCLVCKKVDFLYPKDDPAFCIECSQDIEDDIYRMNIKLRN